MKYNNFFKTLMTVSILMVGTIWGQDDFETWPLTSFTTVDSGITVEQENTIVYRGSSSAKITVNTKSQKNTDWRQSVPLTANVTYRISFKIYHTNGGVRARIYANGYENYSNPSKTGEWQTLFYDYTPTSTNNYNIGLRFYDTASFSNSEVLYIDDFTISVAPITWQGTTTNWKTASNWSSGTVPTNADNVLIPTGAAAYPTVNSAIVDVPSITIESGATAIFETTTNANVTYLRNIADANWHLIAAPLKNVDTDVFVADANLDSSGSNLGLGTYVNTNATGSKWTYYQNGATGTGNFTDGQGHSIKLKARTDITFKGKMNTSVTNVTIASTGDKFNLVGNPYTAFINSNTFFSNTTNGVALNQKTIWLWNGTTYETFNETKSLQIAPAQGFFVEAAGSTITLNTAMLSHQTTDTFMRTASKTNLVLTATEGNNKVSTDVFYLNEATKNFDNGYDSTIFGGVSYDFNLFTQQPTNDEGKKLAIQSLPNTTLEQTVVPVGLIAEAGKQVTFSVQTTNLPSGIEVYLEDRTNGVFTNLSEQNYSVTLTEKANGIGQFYLHTTSQKLSTNTITKSLDNVSIYKSATSQLTIAGLQATKATVTMYSILGKQVVNKTITSNGITTINLPKVAAGVYVVKVNSSLGEVTKKITLN